LPGLNPGLSGVFGAAGGKKPLVALKESKEGCATLEISLYSWLPTAGLVRAWYLP
jgi:hypothetical protein